MLKQKLIGAIVICVMSVIANYPVYKELQESAKVTEAAIDSINSILSGLNNELNKIENDILDIYIKADITRAQLTSEIDSTLNKIDKIKFETQLVNQKLDKMVSDKINKKEEELKTIIKKQPIPGFPGF